MATIAGQDPGTKETVGAPKRADRTSAGEPSKRGARAPKANVTGLGTRSGERPQPARPPEAADAAHQDAPEVHEEAVIKGLNAPGTAVVAPPPQAPARLEPEPEATPEPARASAESAIPSMFVVMIASELAPVAKVGGLADVVYGLSRELEIRGHAVEIILPKYDCMHYGEIWGLTMTYQDLWVPWYGASIHCSVWFGFVHGRKCFFIEPHSQDNFFNRGAFYGFKDEALRFAFFSKAALEFLLQSGKRPDIIHIHDWQTALVPVLLYEIYKFHGMDRQRVCFTIHNFKHQGVTGTDLLNAVGLGGRAHHFLDGTRLRDDAHPGAINLMKGGIVYSNFITTVSPHYAWEVLHTGENQGLGPVLHTHRSKFGGILNGLDYDTWNPELDRYIPFHYGAATLDQKYRNKEALRERLWLRTDYKPIIAYVGRLDAQKGVHLIRHAIFYALAHGAQFVLLGASPDPGINQSFWALKNQLNNNPDCHLEIGYNEGLAHLIYAGSDMIILPSNFEPCGLTQLIGLKYGTVPIVRNVGGLADTVFDRDYSGRPIEERNGYVFHHSDGRGIESALQRAIGLWYAYPAEFRHLMLAGMRQDYSWNHSGQHYLNVYDYIRHK
ncbi:MAG: glycogen synthase GlgA [Betaproteobacteria bacterium]|nr:glycogen synthase GlgA [Betaproteobacteria bacterium]